MINIYSLKMSMFFIKRYGVRQFFSTLKKKIEEATPVIVNGVKYQSKYEAWIAQNEPTESELQLQRDERFSIEPKISIVAATFNTPVRFLKEMINSVLSQTYSKWELCIADGGSKEEVKAILNEYKAKDSRIKVKYLKENRGISDNFNAAISIATGEYIGFLDHDDMLAPYAIYEIVRAINEDPDAECLYSDEDKIDRDSRKRFEPHFKPDWSPDLLRSLNYICHFFVIKKDLLGKIGVFRKDFDGAQDYDLILRATERAKKIIHIPKILYHWRVNKRSTAGGPDRKIYAYRSARKALEEHLKRTGLDGRIEMMEIPGCYKVSYRIPKTPLLSIIIPNRNNVKTLKKCIDSLYKGIYKNFEILIVENGSTEEGIFKLYEKLQKDSKINVLSWNRSFNFSAINNFASQYAKGELLLFLNNDMEAINKDCLERMVEHAIKKEVGAVGAKLYYPNNTIQHAGIVIGIRGFAGHSHKMAPGDSQGYFFRLKVIQNVSAVTGACLMTRKELFNQLGGFDEDFSVALNDVDFCLRLRENGYLIVWTPFAEFYHYESLTRGYDDGSEKLKRLNNEINMFRERWEDLLEKGDPYYSPNLTLSKEDFSIKIFVDEHF